MERLYKIWIILLIVLLSAPALQYTFRVFPEKPLHGVTIEDTMPDLNLTNYFNFSYQSGAMQYLDQNFGFRPFFIRIFNQIQFSLFNIPHGRGVVIGKNNYLYERWYIRDYLGYYSLGNDSIQRNIQKLQHIRKYLLRHNTELMVLLAPGKGYYYPEFIPDQFQRKKTRSNYELYRSGLDTSGIPFFDVNRWFIQMKNERPEPLFTQTGTHWSEFGAALVADSLIRFTGHLLQQPMNHIYITGTEYSNQLRGTDNDLADLMNVFFPINRMEAAYAIIERDNDIPKEQRPAMIVISDSYFWNLYDGSLNDAYSSIQYWYYYSRLFPQSFRKKTYVKDVKVNDYLESADLVVVMASTALLTRLGFGFIEDAYKLALLDEQATPDDSTNAEDKTD